MQNYKYNSKPYSLSTHNRLKTELSLVSWVFYHSQDVEMEFLRGPIQHCYAHDDVGLPNALSIVEFTFDDTIFHSSLEMIAPKVVVTTKRYQKYISKMKIK